MCGVGVGKEKKASLSKRSEESWNGGSSRVWKFPVPRWYPQKKKELRDRYIKIGRLFLSFFCYLQRANEAVQVEYSRCGPEQGEHVAERGDGIRADPTGLTRDQTRMETVAQGNVKT